MSLTVNQDQRISVMLLDLKRHLKVCDGCTAAVKARAIDGLCAHTVGLIISIAVRYDTLIPRRLAAVREGVNVIYACPDLGAHGASYPMIAEPLQAIGVQGTLF